MELPICSDCSKIAFSEGVRDCVSSTTSSGRLKYRPSGSKKREPRRPNRSCIATAWLKQRGLENAAILHAGFCAVFCIPSLPCGTPGHLLRQCNKFLRCTLVTYREVCETRSDCIESTTAVSQLSHSFEWSAFRAPGKEEGTTLELTSLSVHSLSSPSSPYRFIANAADRLNSMGLGSICNAVALFAHRLNSDFPKFMVSESSGA